MMNKPIKKRSTDQVYIPIQMMKTISYYSITAKRRRGKSDHLEIKKNHVKMKKNSNRNRIQSLSPSCTWFYRRKRYSIISFLPFMTIISIVVIMYCHIHHYNTAQQESILFPSLLVDAFLFHTHYYKSHGNFCRNTHQRWKHKSSKWNILYKTYQYKSSYAFHDA